MSFFKRAKEVSADLAGATRRQAQRGKLELDARRIEGKIDSEKEQLGRDLYPLLEEGKLQLDLPEVREHMEAIAALKVELAAKRDEIEALSRDGDEKSEPESAPPPEASPPE
jgi:hypothetical protein